MGVKGLYSLIRKNCPEQIREVDMRDLAGYKIAVDVSIYLYRSVRSCGVQRWLDSFISFVCDLKRFRIHPIYIFDGPNPPPEKRTEQNRRRAQLNRQLDRLAKAERFYEILMRDYVPFEREPSPQLKEDTQSLLRRSTFKHKVEYSDAISLTNALRDKIECWKNQTVHISPMFAEKAKDVLTLLGLPYLQADGEAETLCSFLGINGHVDAVLSDDTDVLAYGTPLVFSQITRHPGRSTVTIRGVVHVDLCKGLGVSPLEFKDLCILLGCDYNQRAKMPGKKPCTRRSVGEVRAYALIEDYRRLENIEPLLVDPLVLNYPRCRDLFTVPSDSTLDSIKFSYAKPIAENDFLGFMADNHCRLSHDFIRNLWSPATPFNVKS